VLSPDTVRHRPGRVFAMIRALLKALILLLVPVLARCDSLDDAVRLLAGKVSTHLSANEIAHVTVRNISSLPAGESARAQTALARALRRRGTGTTIEVALTLSENLKDYLLVAEVRKTDATAVEMAPFRINAPPAAVPLPISRRLLWSQNDPILDLTIAGDNMLVLDPSTIASYERRDGHWAKLESIPIESPPLRDPRARMETSGQEFRILFPGMTCRGTTQPLTLNCEAVNSDFTLNGAPVHFMPGRNAIEGGAEAVSACGGNLDASDGIALYRGTTLTSEPMPMPGPVTAFWPLGEGALAVVHNLAARQYNAYAISVDCGH
jgi:hypothetical protein